MIPALEAACLRAIDEREDCIARVHSLLASRRIFMQPDDEIDRMRRELADVLSGLRMAGVTVCETIGRWRRRREHSEAFVWHSHNYMLKMLVDLNFLGTFSTLDTAIADPFLTSCFSPSGSAPRPAQSAAPAAEAPKAALPADTIPPTVARYLRQLFSAEARLTKHELVRIKGAERLLAAEVSRCAFTPTTPTLEDKDLESRAAAAFMLFGTPPPEDVAAEKADDAEGALAGRAEAALAVETVPSLGELNLLLKPLTPAGVADAKGLRAPPTEYDRPYPAKTAKASSRAPAATGSARRLQ